MGLRRLRKPYPLDKVFHRLRGVAVAGGPSLAGGGESLRDFSDAGAAAALKRASCAVTGTALGLVLEAQASG